MERAQAERLLKLLETQNEILAAIADELSAIAYGGHSIGYRIEDGRLTPRHNASDPA